MLETFVAALGWLGTGLLLTAYFLLSTQREKATSVSYQLKNVFGAILLLANAAYHGAYPPAVLELVWAIIGIFAIVKSRLDMRNAG